MFANSTVISSLASHDDASDPIQHLWDAGLRVRLLVLMPWMDVRFFMKLLVEVRWYSKLEFTAGINESYCCYIFCRPWGISNFIDYVQPVWWQATDSWSAVLPQLHQHHRACHTMNSKMWHSHKLAVHQIRNHQRCFTLSARFYSRKQLKWDGQKCPSQNETRQRQIERN